MSEGRSHSGRSIQPKVVNDRITSAQCLNPARVGLRAASQRGGALAATLYFFPSLRSRSLSPLGASSSL